MQIPLTIPSLDEGDIANAVSVLRSGQLVQGKEVAKLEASISAYLGSRNAICASNGTATLHLALLAFGIGPGDEVIVPALSYIATANVVEIVGAKPVFVDIDLATFCIRPDCVEQAITKRTKAIIPVHEFGLMAEMKAIREAADVHGLHILEDAACALGAQYSGKFAGTLGDIGSFSLHPRKAITTGEGGILVTNDDSLARQLRILRNHGMEFVDGSAEFVAAGLNYRITDFQAALLHNQVLRLDGIIEKRQSLARRYASQIRNSAVSLPFTPSGFSHTWQTYHILWSGKASRDEVISKLRDKGIGTNYGAQCIPAQKYFQAKYGLDSRMLFPNALRAFEQGIALPMYDRLTEREVDYVSQELNAIK